MRLPFGVYCSGFSAFRLFGFSAFRLFAFQSVVGSTTSPVKIKYHSISPLGLLSPLDLLVTR
jgi:hypothetical protein